MRQPALPDESGKRLRGFCSYQQPVIVLARRQIESHASLYITAQAIEKLVLVHEVGHALGLVSVGCHEIDGHCIRPRCVMYPAFDGRSALANWLPALFGRLPADDCPACREDLARLRDDPLYGRPEGDSAAAIEPPR